MISLYLKNYAEKEVEELEHLFEVLNTYLLPRCKPGVECSHCDYRHVCSDLERAKKYVHNYKGKP